MDLTFAALQQPNFSGFVVADVALAEGRLNSLCCISTWLWSWPGLEESLSALGWRAGTRPLGGWRWDAVPPHYSVALWQELLEKT